MNRIKKKANYTKEFKTKAREQRKDTTPVEFTPYKPKTRKAFDGFEVVVATHIDRDNRHNHFVVNSVNCERKHGQRSKTLCPWTLFIY